MRSLLSLAESLGLRPRFSLRAVTEQILSALAVPILTMVFMTPNAAVAASVPMLAAGEVHSCSLDSTGAVRCWGDNYQGKLGDGGSSVSRATPTLVSALGSGIQAIAAGNNHTCAITSSNGLKCWGANDFGGLGDGTTTSRSTPVDVTGLTSGVVAVSAGQNHTCARLLSGAVKCWGNNGSGQLGTGNTLSQSSPATVTGLSGSPVAIALGGDGTCALLVGGGMQCWGQGRLGDGTTTSRSTPTNVLSLAGPVARMAMGSDFTCALLVDTSLQCWGRNGSGQLGDGTTTQRLVPNTVPSISAVTAIAAGQRTACAVVSGGALKCWGYGNYGKIGNGLEQSFVSTPQAVIGLSSGAASVAIGSFHACALTTGGNIRCWGRNTEGELGLGYYGLQLTPTDVSGISSGTTAIAAGGFHACARDSTGAVKCWGSRSVGSVGDGVISSTPQRTPVPVQGLATAVAQIGAGLSQTCVVTSSGGAKCWGGNSSSQIGDNTIISRATPVDVVTLTSGAAAISGGNSHTCAVTTAGGVKCWGANDQGQLGNGTTSFSLPNAPVDVTGLSSGVVAVSVNGSSACALLGSNGGVKCWGYNGSGQLGDGTTTASSTPIDVVGLSSGVAALGVGFDFTCALLTVGTVKCWGDNTYGQLGQGGTITSSLTPIDTLPLGGVVTKLGAGGSHACVVLSAGMLKCWGQNAAGQMGDGTLANRPAPIIPVGLNTGVGTVSAGAQFTCALMTSGTIKCWGDNQAAMMGNGTEGNETTATRYTAGVSLSSPLNVSDRATVAATVDGTIIARYLSGIGGAALVQGVDATGSLRTDAEQMATYLDTIRPLLDIDGNGEFNPLTDGLLLIRYLLGQRDAALITGAVGNGATRTTAATIQAYLATIIP